MSSTTQLTKTKPQAELIVTWPDKTETRHVRPLVEKDEALPRKAAPPPGMDDEDHRLVLECAPYTASFNHLLKDRRPNENPRQFVALVRERMHADAVPMNTVTYNLLMGRLVRFTDGGIFDLYEELKVEGTKENSSVQPNKETFALLFRACERSAEYHRAFLLYQEMRELFGITPDTVTYNTLLGFCGAVKDVAQACYLVEEMKANGVRMDTNTYNCYMSVLVDAAPYAETMAVFNSMCNDGARPTVRTYNTLLKAMRAHGDFDKGFQTYEEMKKHGCLPDIVTYNMLLWLCEERLDYVLGTGHFRHLSRSQEQKSTGTAAVANLTLTLLAEMQSAGVQPNTFSYNKVLAVLLRCEDPRLFSVYARLQQTCTAATTSPTTRSFAQGSQARPSLHRESDSSASQRSLRTHVTLSTPAASAPNAGVPSVNEASSVAPTAPPTATTAAVGTPLQKSVAAGSSGGGGILSPRTVWVPRQERENVTMSLEEAMREEDPMEEGGMRAVGVRANMVTEKLIMRALLLFEKPEKCKQLHLQNRKLYAPFRLTTNLAAILFEVCERTLDRAWAEALLDEVVGLKLRIDVDLFNAYLAVLSAVGDPALLEHFHQMRLGIHPLGVCANVRTFTIVLRSYLRQQQLAEGLALFASMRAGDPNRGSAGDTAPNDETFEVVIQLYDRLHDTDGAVDVVARALESGCSLGTPVFHQLLRMLARHKDARTESWFERMRQAGEDAGKQGGAVPPVDAECYAIVMEYYLERKQYDDVARLFREVKSSQGLEPTAGVYRVVIDMYRLQRNRKAMSALFDDARLNSIRLDVPMYNTILEPFVETKDPFVFEVLSEMRQNRVPAEDSTMAVFLASPGGRQQLTEAVSHNLFYKPSTDDLPHPHHV